MVAHVQVRYVAQSAEQGSFVTSAAGWKSEISVLGVVAVMNVTGVAGCRLE